MSKIIKYTILVTVITTILPSTIKSEIRSGDIPQMPLKANYENSLENTWSQKKVHSSKLLSDAEIITNWKYSGESSGSMTLSKEITKKGNFAILLESPTQGTRPTRNGGGDWGYSVASRIVDNEDWSDWNRITFWIYPDMPGHKTVSLILSISNAGEEKVPDLFPPNGFNVIVLESQKWNKVYWEIAHLGRDKVTGVTFQYPLRGNEAGASKTARLFIDEIQLEKVDADHFEGWNVAPGEISYNHAGYVNGFPKLAFTSENHGQRFLLKDIVSGKIIKNGVVTEKTTPTGTFRMMDFSDVNNEGKYILEVGKLKTKPFSIGAFSDVFRSSIISTINHFYTQRCGFAVLGVHDACHLDFMCTHDEKSIPIHGGWHDAGDLSQGLVNTGEAAYSMMMLAGKVKKIDPVLYDRLMEEAEWGVSWVIRTRFGDGFRNVWGTKAVWTDNIIGTGDDFNSNASREAHGNLIATTTEAYAAIAFKDKNPFLSANSLKCAIEDYGFVFPIEPRRLNAEVVGAALNAALALYEATLDEAYKKAAVEHAGYLISCQQQDDLDSDLPLKGFFYRTPEKTAILHYEHRAHEQDVVVGLVKLSTLFPSEAAEWKKALRLYADYYKEVCKYTAPYYMISAGIYDLTKSRSDKESEQIMSGVKLNERYYAKRFPVWHTSRDRDAFRGNSGIILTQAKGLATVANFLKDNALLEIAYHTFGWHLGQNPFAQSLMYGEGYRFGTQYTPSSGNLVGGLPVGVQTHFNRDLPYWPAENCWVYKEIWVHPSTRWLMLASDFIQE